MSAGSPHCPLIWTRRALLSLLPAQAPAPYTRGCTHTNTNTHKTHTQKPQLLRTARHMAQRRPGKLKPHWALHHLMMILKKYNKKKWNKQGFNVKLFQEVSPC